MEKEQGFLAKSKYLMIFLVFVLGLAVFTWAIWLIGSSSNQPLSNIKTVQGKTYINEKGEEWGPLPQGDYKFQVSSNSAGGPVFLEGEINPPDVHVGDTQVLRVVVQSPAGIKSVIAYIETDNGEEVLPLIKTGTVAFKDMLPEKYVVAANGNLKILTKKEIAKLHKQKIAMEKDGLINPAQAQSGVKESWEASWVVYDTHNTTYHTTFVAEDNAGQTNSLTIAWSDLCGIPLSGDWNIYLNGHCTISVGQVDGVDNGTVTIEDYNLTVIGTFAFNPGEEIKMINDGKITMSSGVIKKTKLWVCDPDGDGYVKAAALGDQSAQDAKPTNCRTGEGARRNIIDKVLAFLLPKPAEAEICGPSGQTTDAIRRYTVRGTPDDNNSGYDCSESSSWANPGSTFKCFQHRGDGSFDYDCDGDEELTYQNISSYTCGWDGSCYDSCNPISGSAGWRISIPPCGESGDWSQSCNETGQGGSGCPEKQYTCNSSIVTYVTQKQDCN